MRFTRDTNVVVLEAFVAVDPVVKLSPEGQVNYARFRIALEGTAFNTGEDATFVDVISFGKTAAFVDKHVTKGGRYRVLGRIGSNGFKDSQGNPRIAINIVAEDIAFAAWKVHANEETLDYTQGPDKDDGLGQEARFLKKGGPEECPF